MKMRPRQLFSVLAVVAVVLLSACGAPAPSTPTAYRDVGVKYQVVFEDDFACPVDLASRIFYTEATPTLELQTSGGYWTYWTVTIPHYWRAEHGGGYSEGLGITTIGDARCQVTINNVDTTIKVPAQ